MKGLHDAYNEMEVCSERLRQYVNQTEAEEYEEKLRKRDELAQAANEDIFKTMNILTMEQQRNSSSFAAGRSTSNKRSRFRSGSSSSTSHASKVSSLEEDRINKLSQIAALKAELVFESEERELQTRLMRLQKKKKIAALEA